MPDKKAHRSPSGSYSLTIVLTVKQEEYWQFSMAQVENVQTGDIISVVHRNYPAFPFAWAENHPDGHDYLVCGEDYQGQTVIQLDTGLRKDYLPQAAKKGVGFCWVDIDADVELTPPILRAEGCYWACPFENVRYDFSDPLALPYPELERWYDDEEEDEDE